MAATAVASGACGSLVPSWCCLPVIKMDRQVSLGPTPSGHFGVAEVLQPPKDIREALCFSGAQPKGYEPDIHRVGFDDGDHYLGLEVILFKLPIGIEFITEASKREVNYCAGVQVNLKSSR